MADWPDVEELKQVLNITSEDWDGEEGTLLTGVLASAIEKVKGDVGVWDDDVNVPNVQQSRAALRMAELMALRPESAAEADKDPVYRMHLFGQRQRFGIS